MELIADESVDYAIIRFLRESGHKIHSILEKSPGIDDHKVLEIANDLTRLLLTEDKVFGELTYRLNKPHHGILLIRLSRIPREERIILVSEFISNYGKDLIGKFSVITEQGFRIKDNRT